MEKLYVIARADLLPGVLLAQATHAALAFALQFPGLTAQWAERSENLVILAVPDEPALGHLLRRASELSIQSTPYHEPAMDNALTACAFAGEIGKIVSSLPLALREPKAARAA